jgi:hypothetical protein
MGSPPFGATIVPGACRGSRIATTAYALVAADEQPVRMWPRFRAADGPPSPRENRPFNGLAPSEKVYVTPVNARYATSGGTARVDRGLI